jgi:hypothetical protein
VPDCSHALQMTGGPAQPEGLVTQNMNFLSRDIARHNYKQSYHCHIARLCSCKRPLVFALTTLDSSMYPISKIQPQYTSQNPRVNIVP